MIRMFTRKIIYIIIAAVAVVLLFSTAPYVLRALNWATTPAPPTEQEVCTHLTGDLSLPLPNCENWLSASKQAYGRYYETRLRCMAASTSREEASRCDQIVHLAQWGN